MKKLEDVLEIVVIDKKTREIIASINGEDMFLKETVDVIVNYSNVKNDYICDQNTGKIYLSKEKEEEFKRMKAEPVL